MTKAPPPCPKCKSTATVPVAYGLPSPEAFRLAERREITLGGCIVGGDDPNWACNSCGHRFRVKERA